MSLKSKYILKSCSVISWCCQDSTRAIKDVINQDVLWSANFLGNTRIQRFNFKNFILGK